MAPARKNDIVSEGYPMKKNYGLVAALAVLVAACVTNAETTDAVTAEQPSTWDRSYGGTDKSYDTELLQLRELIAPRFQTPEFDDKVTGRTMTYSLYIPAGYDGKKSYPMVLFMADASTTGKGPEAPLKQGY